MSQEQYLQDIADKFDDDNVYYAPIHQMLYRVWDIIGMPRIN